MLTDISLKQSPKKRALNFILLTAAGLLINFGGARLAQGFRLPLFLDTAGTITAAALGGSIPGVTVGFLTNMINSVQDHSTLYYGSMNVLIAIVTAWFSRKGYFRKIRGLLLSILVFSLIGGGLGSMVTWLIYGLDFGNGISAPLAHRIYDAVFVSSTDVCRNYSEGFGVRQDKVFPYGIPRTDDFFDLSCRETMKEKVYADYPMLKGKKVILFAPTFRGNGKQSAYYEKAAFRPDEFIESLPEDYILLIKHHPFVTLKYKIKKENKDRIFDFSAESEINDHIRRKLRPECV